MGPRSSSTICRLVSLHAPTSRDLSAMRESGTPLSICEVERVRRVEAMDELKRVIDVADDLPYARLIPAHGRPPRNRRSAKRDAAFSTLEHLILHAHHAGVAVCIENTTSEMGDPAYLRASSTKPSSGLRFNFDIGHAHLSDFRKTSASKKVFRARRFGFLRASS